MRSPCRLLALIAALGLMAALRPAAALDPDKAFHHYVRSQWSIEQGLPQISALAITQDAQGYVWVGTQAGLARFDGVRFTSYTPESTPGLAGLWVHDLHVDDAGRVWIATYRGLSVHESGRFQALPVAGREDQPVDVRALAALADGRLAAATPDGVYVVEGGQLQRRHPLPQAAYALLPRADGLWVGSVGRVFVLEGEQTRVLPLPEDAADAVVTELLEAQGRLWAGTSAGLFYRESGRWQRHEGGAPLDRSSIELLYEDRDGNLWVGMVRGLARLQAGRVREVVLDDALASAVRAAYEDREGNLWLGSQWEGVARLWNGWTRRYSTREGLADRILWSTTRGADGQLWVGANDGLWRMEGGRFQQVVSGEDLPHPNAYTLLAEDGRVWIGTRRGAAVWRSGQLEQPPELAPLRSLQINGIHRDRRGALWFATTGGLFRLTRDGLQALDSHGLRDPRTRVLHETRDGRLLLGTQSGLYQILDDRVQPLGEDAGLPPRLDITAIHELPDGRWVVGALSGEVHLFDGQRWHGFGRAEGMPVNSAFFISHDDEGYLWVAGIRGILRVPVADLDDYVAGRRTRVRGEMLLNERGDRFGGQKGYCCNGAGNAKGFHFGDELWLPSRDGLVALSTREIVRNPVPPRTVVERVRVGEHWRAADAGAGWTLPLGARDLEFEFTVLSLQEPTSTDLRYRLIGYDPDWRTLGDPMRRSAVYTNLPPGAYVFEAQGANNAGVWGEAAAQLGFTVPPHFHETPLFYALLATVLASLVYGGYRYQRGAYLRQRDALERLVAQRTEALAAANQRLEEASQTDPLTGLRNRRYLASQIPADIAFYDRESLRHGGPAEVMVFALVDIDHFKQVNDRHGHGVGDRVLQQFAKVLANLVRTGDYIARWGGEEFLVVFRPMPNRHVPVLGERIREAVARNRFDAGLSEPLHLTCSIGFVECPLSREGRGQMGWEQMVELADRALYHVKANGRDGWALYRPRGGVGLDAALESLRQDPASLPRDPRLDLLTSAGLGRRA